MECLGRHKVRWCHLSHFTSLGAPEISPGLLYPLCITLGLKAGPDSEGLNIESRMEMFSGRELWQRTGLVPAVLVLWVNHSTPGVLCFHLLNSKQ